MWGKLALRHAAITIYGGCSNEQPEQEPESESAEPAAESESESESEPAAESEP